MSSSSLSDGADIALDWSVRGRLVEVSPVSTSECFLLEPLVGAEELDVAPSSSSESTIIMSSLSSAGSGREDTNMSQSRRTQSGM